MWTWPKRIVWLAQVLALLLVIISGGTSLVHAKKKELLRGLQEEEEEEDSAVPYRGIIAGETANAADYPWNVIFQGTRICGGTVVGDGNFVMTAAHCLENYMPQQGT